MTINKKLIAMAALSLGLWQAQAKDTGDTIRLKLNDALDLAQKQSLSLKSATVGVEKARSDKRVGIAKLFPTINLNGQYGYTLKKQKVYFGSEDASKNPLAGAFPSDGIEMGQSHNITTTLSASLPLVSPQLWASLELDRVAVETALEKVRASSVALRAEVRKAYMAVLFARESLRVQEESLRNMEQNYENIKLKYNQGLVAEYDLIRMDAQVKNLKPSINQSMQQLRLAKMKLLVLLDLDAYKELVLEDDLASYKTQLTAPEVLLTSEDQLRDNTNLRSLELSQKQLEVSIKTKKMEYLPTLGLSFNYNYNFASDYFRLDNSKRWTPSSTIGLSLSVPLFTGGSTRHGIKSLKWQAEQLKIERTSVRHQLQLQYTSQQDAQRTAIDQYQSSTEAERSAKKGLEIATVRYKAGNGTLLELNDAELTLRQAQLQQAQAVYNYMVATYSLEELQGH